MAPLPHSLMRCLHKVHSLRSPFLASSRHVVRMLRCCVHILLTVRTRSVSVGEASEATTITCDIPLCWSEPIAAIEVEINGEFSELKQNLDMGREI